MTLRTILSLAVAGAVGLAGCASFDPGSVEDVGFLERAETRVIGELRVSVAVPTQTETRQLFDSKLYKKKIQPVWVEIENRTSEPVLLFPYSVDPDYFPPLEVAYLSHRIWAPKTNWRIDRFVYEQSFPQFVPPGATESGFVFTNLHKGAKYVPVDLFFEQHIEGLEFFVSVPAFGRITPQWTSKSYGRRLRRLSCPPKRRFGSGWNRSPAVRPTRKDRRPEIR